MIDRLTVDKSEGLILFGVGHCDPDLLDDRAIFEIIKDHSAQLVFVFAITNNRSADPLQQRVQECFGVCAAGKYRIAKADKVLVIYRGDRVGADALRNNIIKNTVNLVCVHVFTLSLK